MKALYKHKYPDNVLFQIWQDHKDKYIDTSGKILSQEMLMCNMKALKFIF